MPTAQHIVERVREAGVVGAGGAGFPTHVKLAASAEIFLVNGAECEPMLKVDQQLVAKYPQEMVRGLRLGMIATGAREGVICLKEKYGEAIAAIKPLLEPDMRLHILRDVYPAGDEVITIWMATGRRVPPGQIPLSIGVVVNNPLTLINVARAVDQGQPVTTRTLTVSGAVARPATFTVPLGTPLREVLEKAGGATIANPAYLEGGPMMGKLVTDLERPVTKTTGGLLVFPDDHLLIQRRTVPQAQVVRIAETNCVQCNLCTDLCPRHVVGHELSPHLLVRSSNFRNVGAPRIRTTALTCSECGVCEAYACPVDISPMRINMALKTVLRAEGQRYEGVLHAADPLGKERLLPSHRLVEKIRIAGMAFKAPLLEDEWHPPQVTLPLRQHIGVAALPVVEVGQHVRQGELLARIVDGALGAGVHASIDGCVYVVNHDAIVLVADRLHASA
ncbi:MAG: SLBB domain-containing protein [Paucibacter sp.]|nr:SLBB domain-containing protein [Roseateles sp.]